MYLVVYIIVSTMHGHTNMKPALSFKMSSFFPHSPIMDVVWLSWY